MILSRSQYHVNEQTCRAALLNNGKGSWAWLCPDSQSELVSSSIGVVDPGQSDYRQYTSMSLLPVGVA